MEIWLMITHSSDGPLEVFTYANKDDAEDALIADVSDTFGSPLVRDEWNSVVLDAYQESGFMMDGAVPDVSNTWYMRKIEVR